jgi:CD80-like C2-set immunoglobulin domain
VRVKHHKFYFMTFKRIRIKNVQLLGFSADYKPNLGDCLADFTEKSVRVNMKLSSAALGFSHFSNFYSENSICVLQFEFSLVPPDSVIIANGPVVEVTAGHRYGLTCRALGGKPAATITWQSPAGEVLPEDQLTPENFISNQADGLRQDALSRLSLVPSISDEGRQYVCLAMNAAMINPISTSVNLRVLCMLIFI